MTAAWLATLNLVAGAACLYVSAPNQALVRPPVNGRTLRFAGGGGLVVALALLLSTMGPATAVFTWVTGLMLLWSVPPIVVRWLRYRKEAGR